jgi:[ribosomal protein S5]-alanine N-acetyltransferase
MGNFMLSPKFQTIPVDPERVHLRQLSIDDVSEEYVGWLNDPETVRFLEIRHSLPISRTDVIDFVKNCHASHRPHWGIFVDNEHKGNISCSGYSGEYRWAHISNLIGDEDFRKTNLCKLALGSAIDYLFDSCKMHKIQAGTYSEHFAGITLLTNLGFKKEGTLRESVIFEGQFLDSLRFGILHQEWQNKENRPPKVQITPLPWNY